MGKFIVEYCPNISEQAEKIIIENVTPSMTSSDGDSHQYSLDFIMTDVFEQFESEDKLQLTLLTNQNVDYIEF